MVFWLKQLPAIALCLIIILCGNGGGLPVFAQTNHTQHQSQDTTRQKHKQPRHERLKMKKNKSKPGKPGNFYRDVEKNFSKHKVTRFLYKQFFRVKKEGTGAMQGPGLNHAQGYEQYNGKVIRHIYVKKLDIFGSSINDTTRKPKSWFERAGNSLHIKTSTHVIGNHLIFKEGSIFIASEIQNNERLLRSLPYIKDARIYVLEPDSAQYYIDLLVITKDVFPIAFDFEPADIDQATIEANHFNLFGQGHELDNRFEINNNNSKSLGYDGTFRVRNLRGSFITAEVQYADMENRKWKGIRAYRTFVTPEIQYAGGIEVSRKQLYEFRQMPDTLLKLPYSFWLQDVWLGKAYRSFYNPPVQHVRERLRLILSGRVMRLHFFERPLTTADANQIYRNRTLVLGQVALSHREYIKDNLIFGFGRTEDVPSGYLMALTFGHEWGEFNNRSYLGLTMGRGRYFNDGHYLSTTIKIGGFLRRGLLEEGVVAIRSDWFTRLIPVGQSQFRQFVSLEYTHGVRRYNEEFIDIRDGNGIRGLKSNQLRGTQRLVLRAEGVLFSPFELLTFRVAPFFFADVGWVSQPSSNLFQGQFYQGYSLGFRLRNDNLAIGTLQIRLGYYPRLPPDAAPSAISFSSLPRLSLPDFVANAPEVLQFANLPQLPGFPDQ